VCARYRQKPAICCADDTIGDGRALIREAPAGKRGRAAGETRKPGALCAGPIRLNANQSRAGYAAAFLRLASSRASTKATCASIAALLRPFCLAISCTSLSARSILGAPFCKARAAEAGRVKLCAAAAYFSNGTRSSGLAPSFTHRSNTKL